MVSKLAHVVALAAGRVHCLNQLQHLQMRIILEQSLLCVLGGPSLYRSSSRFSFAPWHRLIKYKNYVLEWGTNGYSINFNRSLSSQCPITWEEEPAGRSSKSINEVDNFGRMYS